MKFLKNLFNRKPKIKTAPVWCKKCESYDCISLEEYQSRIQYSDSGAMRIKSSDILQSCQARQQMNTLDRMIKDGTLKINS